MLYKEQLTTWEWKEKRMEILKRDNFCCKKCKIPRSKFLGLSQKFGIKNLKEVENEGYSVSLLDQKEKAIIFYKGGYSDTIEYIGSIDKEIKLEDLYFAQKWVEPNNKFALGYFKMICFTVKISEANNFHDLNIHHKYYINNRKAWEYENDSLVTLCCDCHKHEHDVAEIFVYAESGGVLYKAEKCSRCGGSGYLKMFHYYQNGVCFECGGEGVIIE